MPPSSSPPFSPPALVADVHMHTRHSHGEATVREMYLAARARGLAVIGFSEHSPRPAAFCYPHDYQDRLEKGLPDYIREVRELAGEAKRNGVCVLLGIEADYIPTREDFTAAFLKSHPFAYVIGGLHFQDEWGFDGAAADWAPLPRARRREIYVRYYEDMISMCESGLFDIAAHPDLVKIFSVGDFRDWMEEKSARALVGEALKAMRDNGVLMEVSSAGLRKPCREIYPGPRIMALAAKLELPISFASDAHCVNTPAYAFPALADYAASFGYKESWVVVDKERKHLPFTASGRQ
ncbi:MAG: histidinol-phosphatase [Desulfovibrio sp.]|nr:histidinol-phosphatase [Desulfovibrio sp.]